MLVLAVLWAASCQPAPEQRPAAAASPAAQATATLYPPLRWQFPPLYEPPDNRATPVKVELGRQLFFDPVLSASNAMSCATCHHPDLGFSNGAAVSSARPGAAPRNVATLWNSGYNQLLLWDGRETSLESQARLPLTLASEMAADPEALVAELAAIPAYGELFAAAFPEEAQAVSFETIRRALAAFQRTLISDDSPFDRFAAGDQAALSPAQQRGLALFFSQRARCAECHTPPSFASETFRVIGVDSADPGRAGVSPSGVPGAFKVPTLRNIAATAPYMHDGSLATLQAVLDFYSEGAGRARGVANVDPFVTRLDLSAQEKADLLAFLQALTDESKLPTVPEVAVSGLPTAPRIERPTPSPP